MATLRPHRLRLLALTGLLALVGGGWAAQRVPDHLPPPAIHDSPGDRKPVPCPADAVVVVLFGQSLSANSGIRMHGPTAPPTYNFLAGHCYPLRDPMLGAAGNGGSIGPPLAAMASAGLGRPVVLIAGGIGGTSITQWTAPASPMLRLLRDRLDEARRADLPPAIHIWMQGEADAAMSAEDYAGQLRQLHGLLPPAPWIITSNSVCTGRPERSATLDRARIAFAAATPGVHLGVDMDAIGPAFRQADRCHLNAAGQEAAARMAADAVIRALR